MDSRRVGRLFAMGRRFLTALLFVLLTIPPAVALRPFFGDSHSPKTLAEAAQRANVRRLVVHQRNGSRVEL